MTQEATEAAIVELEGRRRHALMAGDIDALAALMADDLRHVHGSGQVDDKATYLNGVATKYRFHRIERGDLDVRFYGDVAIVMGPLSQTVSTTGVEGSKHIEAMTTQTWVRDHDGWRQNTCHMQFLKVT